MVFMFWILWSEKKIRFSNQSYNNIWPTLCDIFFVAIKCEKQYIHTHTHDHKLKQSQMSFVHFVLFRFAWFMLNPKKNMKHDDDDVCFILESICLCIFHFVFGLPDCCKHLLPEFFFTDFSLAPIIEKFSHCSDDRWRKKNSNDFKKTGCASNRFQFQSDLCLC